MGVADRLGLAYSDEERDLARERRAEFWAWAGRVAVGVFIGQVAFAVFALLVFGLWLDSVL